MIRLRVKEVAEKKGFSLGRLQRDAGVAYNTVKDIYRDPYKETTTTTINKLAAALGVSTTALIEDVSKEVAEHEKATLKTSDTGEA